MLSEVVLEICRTLIGGFILMYLFFEGRKKGIRKQGWLLIMVGLGLVLFGMTIDITDNFPSLNKFIIIGDTVYESFLENAIGYLLGLLFLAVGIRQLFPQMIMLKEKKRELQQAHGQLELRVRERTMDLETEITDRKKIELELRRSEELYRTLVDNAPY